MELNRNELKIIRRALDLEADRREEIYHRAWYSNDTAGTDKIIARRNFEDVINLLERIEEALKKAQREELITAAVDEMFLSMQAMDKTRDEIRAEAEELTDEQLRAFLEEE